MSYTAEKIIRQNKSLGLAPTGPVNYMIFATADSLVAMVWKFPDRE